MKVCGYDVKEEVYTHVHSLLGGGGGGGGGGRGGEEGRNRLRTLGELGRAP